MDLFQYISITNQSETFKSFLNPLKTFKIFQCFMPSQQYLITVLIYAISYLFVLFISEGFQADCVSIGVITEDQSIANMRNRGIQDIFHENWKLFWITQQDSLSYWLIKLIREMKVSQCIACMGFLARFLSIHHGSHSTSLDHRAIILGPIPSFEKKRYISNLCRDRQDPRAILYHEQSIHYCKTGAMPRKKYQ